MKLLIKFSLALLLLAPLHALAQGVRYDNIALLDSGRPAQGIGIRVCSSGSTGTPCTPAASIFSDSALTLAITQPGFQSDAQGNYNFYAACGTYDIQLTGNGVTTKTLKDVQLDGPCYPTSFSVYNTSPPNGTNYERGTIRWNGNVLQILPEAAGTGTVRDIQILGKVNTSSLIFIRTSVNTGIFGFNSEITTNGQVSFFQGKAQMQNTGILSIYNGQNTVSNGVPSLVAKVDLAAQGANIAQTLLFTVPAAGAGTYRASCYLVVTTAASTSSTLPSCQLFFTDNETSVTSGGNATTALTNNTVGLNSAQAANPGLMTFNAKASTAINYATANYASVGATAMQYSVHVKLEYLGN